MEKLTIEQKAKRYDEALKVLYKYDGTNIMFSQSLKEEMFPKLKESEDEKTRAEIVRFIQMEVDDEIVGNKWIAWLEKQGEKETLCSKCRMENPHDLCSYITAFGNCAIENEQKSTDESEQSNKYEELTDFERVLTDICSSWIGFELGWQSYIKDNARSLKDILYKQFRAVQNESSGCESTELKGKTAFEEIKEIEVEDANGVEPKFKVGDWIITSENKVLQITSIEDTSYRFNNESRYWKIYYCDKECRLWTIQDAKDGDILVSLSKMHPFIFNGHYDEDTDYVYAYCGISDIIKDDSFYFDKYPDEEFKVWDSVENVRPATRDQRNLLFQKMKDSGYEWDANKKELKPHYKRIVTNDSRKDLKITT